MEYWGISINIPEGSPAAEKPMEQQLPEIDFLEITGSALTAENVYNRFSANCRPAVRELMPGAFIRNARESGGKILSAFRRNFRTHLDKARDLGALWVSADFAVGNIKENDTAAINDLRTILEGFYANLLTNSQKLLLDIRWPQSGFDDNEWSRNVSFVLANLPFPNLGIAVDAHVHEAGAAAKIDFLIDFLRAWRLRTTVVRFHYEPELGNTLSAKVTEPVRKVFSGISRDIFFSACPLVRNSDTLQQEAENFLTLSRRTLL